MRVKGAAKGWVAVVVLLLLAVLVFGARSWAAHHQHHPADAQGTSSLSPGSGVEAARRAANRAMSDAWEMIGISSGSPTPASKPKGTEGNQGDGCEWDSAVPRSGVELVDVLLMGSIQIKSIMRHKVLNVFDHQLCPPERESLRRLLDDYNRFLKPVLCAFRDLRNQEMLALIDSGRLREWEGSAATDGDVARYSKMLESTGLTPEAAKQKAESSRSSLGACPQVSYFHHDGKYYLMPPAEDLPESVAYYDKVKALALDRMQLLIAWFEANGCVVDKDALRRLYLDVSSRKIE